MGVNLSEPRELGDQLDKHHVIPQITLSTDMISLSHTHTHKRMRTHKHTHTSIFVRKQS